MATPGAAGFAALVRQYYMDGWYPSGIGTAINGFTPSAALIRGTLVNSGERVTSATSIPSNCQGWGRVLLDNTLYFAPEIKQLWVKDDAAGFAQGSVNETQTFKFTVHPTATPFKATLAWTDFPSTPAALPHINNDLDLEVVGPGGTYLGNVFAAGQSTTGGNPDRLNTLEQVVLNAPQAGEYTVTVRSFEIPNGPQPFALIVTGDMSAQGTLGAGCAAAADCGSMFCVDGVCCNAACNAGACDACSVAAGANKDGTCRLLTGTVCDDGSACTQTDTCQAGVCAGANPVVCPMPDACHDMGVCDSMTGACSSPAKPDGTGCDDANACSQVDSCQAGVCTGASMVDCIASDMCHDAGSCDPATGACSNPEKPAGASCDDGNACTINDTCTAGACIAGSPMACVAMDECHEAGVCDSTGACSNPEKPAGTLCSVGQCLNGVCTPPSSTSSSSSSSSSSSGAGGNGASGGMGGAGGIESTGGMGGAGGSRPPLDLDTGCGCRVTSTSENGGFAGLGLGLLLAMRRRRRAGSTNHSA
jgi:MYXO-CTERM domain-containing protein